MTLLRTVILCALLTVFVNVDHMHAQGFNWQYSSRMPMQNPTLFAGVHFSAGFGVLQGELEAPEILPDGTLCAECGPYSESGTANLGFGLGAEYWLESHAALLFEVEITQLSESAEATTAPVSVFGGDPVSTLLEYQSDATLLKLSGSYLRRVGDSQFLFGGGLGVDMFLTSSQHVTQTILGNSSAYFEENGVKSKQRSLETIVPEYTTIVPSMQLQGGYQFPLALGMFCRATAYFELYPLDVIQNTSWTGYSSGISVSVFLGLNPHVDI